MWFEIKRCSFASRSFASASTFLSLAPWCLPRRSKDERPLLTAPLSSPLNERSTFPPPPAVAASADSVQGCIFCGVTAANKAFAVVHEDDEFVIFKDRSPGSKVHLLAIPKKHVDNVKVLRREDAEMVDRMRQVGRTALERMGVPEAQQRMGFHIPPFFSVNHLHLHLLSLPLPFPGKLKYRPSFPKPPSSALGSRPEVKVKGFSWFVEVSQVLPILNAGGQVRVASVKVPVERQQV